MGLRTVLRFDFYREIISMEETQIKQIIERQPLHGSALLDPRCKILLLVCIGFVSYFLAGEVVSLALMLVYGLFIA